MGKTGRYRQKKYSRRLTMDMVTGELKTTTYTGSWWAEYNEYLNSPYWKAKREQRLKIDNYKCVDCESPNNLQVHHKTYVRLRHELMDDLVTLCERCHKNRHLPLMSFHPHR